jgi:hypothetical protein
MILATHQPLFIPWPGFFYKAMMADCLVLLNDVQFPLGRGWINRNRLKCDKGVLWLTVPVYRRGRGLQKIREVEIASNSKWREKHLRALLQNYANAPFIDRYYPVFEATYGKHERRLVSLNLDLIHFLMKALNLETEILVQSALGITGVGTDLIVAVCNECSADRYVTFPAAEHHLDMKKFERAGIEVDFIRFVPPVYPQLWGEFIYNLSTIDILLNCGPESKRIISRSGGWASR